MSQFNSLYQAIATANAFIPETKEHRGGWDKRNVSQLYYGTTSAASTYNGHTVYSTSDFEQFAASTSEKPQASVSKEPDISRYETTIDAEFLRDFTHLSQEGLYTKYREVFYPNYEPSLSTPLILDESEMFFHYPDDYVCVYHKRKGKHTLRWEIGEDRKKKMYITAQIMLFNLPCLSVENLLYNLRLERQWYYDNTDNKISNESLLQTAISAFEKPYPLEPSTHPNFSLNKPFWEGQGFTANQAKMIVRGILKAREVKRLYNHSLTRKENLRILKENGVRISDRTLRRMVSREEIKLISKKPNHTYLSYCPDSDTILILRLIDKNGDIKQSEIASAMNVSLPTVKRYMKAMKGVLIERDGNNRSGRWVVLPHVRKELDKQNVLKIPMEEKQPFISQREACNG